MQYNYRDWGDICPNDHDRAFVKYVAVQWLVFLHACQWLTILFKHFCKDEILNCVHELQLCITVTVHTFITHNLYSTVVDIWTKCNSSAALLVISSMQIEEHMQIPTNCESTPIWYWHFSPLFFVWLPSDPTWHHHLKLHKTFLDDFVEMSVLF